MPSQSVLHGDLIITEDGYRTCDLYMAAFFMTVGCEINKTSRDRHKVFFFFENIAMVEKLRTAYFLRQGEVAPLTYADNIKSLKSLCASIMDREIKKI